MALVASCVTLFYCLFLFQGYQKLFRDSDAGWHIRTGERVLATGVLPRSDSYSFTRAGSPWFAWEWGADVLTGAVHQAAGLSGVALLYGIAIAAGVWLWFRLNWAVDGNFLFACLLAIPLLSTCNMHWLARPHVLSWLFLLATVLCAERVHLPRLWMVAVGSALWTNVHASFLLGPLLLAIYAASHFARPLLWEFDREAEWARAQWFGAAAGIAALATFANPYGWHVHQHVLAYVSDSELLHRVGEFQSFDFQAAGAGQILATVLAAAAGAVLALARRNPAHFLITALLVALGLRSARGLPLVALVGLPLANGAVSEALAAWRGLRPALRRRLDGFLEYAGRLRGFDARFRGWVWAPAAVVLGFVLLRAPGIAAQAGFPADAFPVRAAGELEKLPGGMRLLAPDKFGGYLIYRFDGRVRVFFDGRSDFYGAGFLKDYARLVQVRPGWQDLLRRWDFSHALLPPDYSLVPALESLGWRVIYRDGTAVLLERPNLIAQPLPYGRGSVHSRLRQPLPYSRGSVRAIGDGCGRFATVADDSRGLRAIRDGCGRFARVARFATVAGDSRRLRTIREGCGRFATVVRFATVAGDSRGLRDSRRLCDSRRVAGDSRRLRESRRLRAIRDGLRAIREGCGRFATGRWNMRVEWIGRRLS